MRRDISCRLCYATFAKTTASQHRKSLRYTAIDYTLVDSREGTLASQLNESIEKNDADGFTKACTDYDQISYLDLWKTAILLKVKCAIDCIGGGGFG